MNFTVNVLFFFLKYVTLIKQKQKKNNTFLLHIAFCFQWHYELKENSTLALTYFWYGTNKYIFNGEYILYTNAIKYNIIKMYLYHLKEKRQKNWFLMKCVRSAYSLISVEMAKNLYVAKNKKVAIIKVKLLQHIFSNIRGKKEQC